jgi:hypothetical protein
MTRQLETIAAPAQPADEVSAEVGGPAVSYEAGEAEVEVVEANSGSSAANTNGYRDDHTRHERRNRGRA